MAFLYSLEYNYDTSQPADASVYIQMRRDVPTYLSHITKEEYFNDPTVQTPFATGLFNIPGVVELSLMAFRVWLMKSPVYTWLEVNDPVLSYLANYYGETELQQLPGSGQPDGTGFTLGSAYQRRPKTF